MTVLVAGATGMTGRSLVKQLLSRGQKVRVIVRSRDRLPAEIEDHPDLDIVEASILDLTAPEMAKHVRDCEAVVSCLGHVMNFKGLFGEPRRLCTEATQRLCRAIDENDPALPVRFILMNTVGVRNPDLEEKRSGFERGLLTLLRHALPPHRDNEKAVEALHRSVGRKRPTVEWCAVRPDSLINAEISAYEIEPSPTTGIFTGRPTTRANVARFMVDLLENTELWDVWKFRMPVIMNATESGG